MGQFTVTTPKPGEDTKVGNVSFAGGVAVIDEDAHPSELAYCRAAGYGVAELTDEDVPSETSDDELRAQLEQLEVKVDPRWKTKRLQAELDKATAPQTDEPGDEPGNDEETTS